MITGGNENLTPETSKSWVFGGVFSPSFIPRFSVEANYYNIKVDGAIQTVDAEVTLTNCVVNSDPAACALVTQRQTVSSPQVAGLLQNIAGIETDGLDLNLTIGRRRTSIGHVRFHLEQHFPAQLST